MNFSVVPADGIEFATLAKVENLLARAIVDFTVEVGQEVVTVGMSFPFCAVGAVAYFERLTLASAQASITE